MVPIAGDDFNYLSKLGPLTGILLPTTLHELITEGKRGREGEGEGEREGGTEGEREREKVK